MNLLVLSTWFPYPPDNGSRLRAWHLLRQLRAQGHRLHLIAGVQSDTVWPQETNDGGKCIPEPLADLCETVEALPWRWFEGGGGVRAEVRGLLSSTPRSILETPNPPLVQAIASAVARRPDAVLVLELGMDAYLGSLPLGCPAILEQVEMSGLERAVCAAPTASARLRARLTLSKSNAYWQRRFARYATLTAVSDEEADAVRQVVSGNAPPVAVVPNGVDVSGFPSDAPPDAARLPGRLLYNGSLTYGPNRAAVRFFVRDILPRLVARDSNAHLVVTGRYDPSGDLERELLQNSRVTLTGFLPDLEPILRSARICVVPLQSGGGTRLKILEAWAAYLPVVSTSIGAGGLGGQAGTELEIADDADVFADKTALLLADPAHAACLAENARRLAEARYDWSTIGADLSHLIEEYAHRH